MKKYLLDTNAFFELISFLVGKNIRNDGYNYEDIKKGKCYISKMTELEINSVIGKYGRGEPAQWQKCSRLLSEDGTQQCNHDYFYKGQKPWKKKVCRDMMKLVKEILEGNSSLLKVNTLDVSTAVMDKAKSFMLLSFKYKFGSHDAVIAATAIENSTKENIMYVVTSDRALRAAMKEEGVYFIVPGENDNKV